MSRIEQALKRANEAGADSVPMPPALPAQVGSPEDYQSEVGIRVVTVPVRKPLPPQNPQRAETSVAPQAGRQIDPKLMLSAGADAHAGEQYRKLAATLFRVQAERGAKVVMVSSAAVGEGKSLTAANLALTISESLRQKVLLIDADLRRPSIHGMFDLPNTTGLNDSLRVDRDARLSLVEVSSQLTVLPAGAASADPISALTSDRMRRIIEEASAMFDWVVIDTPPIGLFPDANLLASMVDLIVFVIGAGTTPFEHVQKALKALDRERVVGVVMNRVDEALESKQYYGYYGRRAAGA